MKKAVSLFLALIVLLSAGYSAAEDMEGYSGIYEVPYAGFRFNVPETYRNLAGSLEFNTAEIAEGSYLFFCSYYTAPRDELNKYLDRDSDISFPETVISDGLFCFFSLGNGLTMQRYSQLSGENYPEENAREIGRIGDRSFYLYMDGPNPYFIEDADPAYRDEYTAMASAFDELADSFVLHEPVERNLYAGLVGTQTEFVTTDLDGNTVFSTDLFAQSKITMLNIWATWCGPCEGELEDLQSIYKRYRDKDVSVVGFLYDDNIEAARKMLDEYNVTYLNILMPNGMTEALNVEGFPTTYFFGPDGMMLTEPVDGPKVERYSTILNELLRDR